MLVLLCAVFLLVVVPGLFLWLGGLIQANTDGRSRAGLALTSATQRQVTAVQAAAGQSDGPPWYRRPMRPAFGRSAPAE